MNPIRKWLAALVVDIVTDEKFTAWADQRVDRITDRVDALSDSIPAKLVDTIDKAGDQIVVDVRKVFNPEQIADKLMALLTSRIPFLR